MTDKPELTREQGVSATPEELCAGALRHYDELSTKACSWMNQIPQAIRFWYLEKPKLEAELRALSGGAGLTERPTIAELEWMVAAPDGYFSVTMLPNGEVRATLGPKLAMLAAAPASPEGRGARYRCNMGGGCAHTILCSEQGHCAYPSKAGAKEGA